MLDKVKDKLYIKPLVSLRLELLLNLTDDTNKIEQRIFHMNRCNFELAVEVLMKDLLDKGVAGVVEVLENLLDEMQC